VRASRAHRLGLVNAALGTLPSARAALDADALPETTARRLGLADFGGEAFREPLARLVRALEQEAGLSPLGRHIARWRIQGSLANRLKLQADRSRHPEIARERVEGPLFIVGPPRSGTTILFHALGEDPASLAVQQWKLEFPSPPPQARAGPRDPRVRSTARKVALLDLLLPDLRSLYPLGAELPQECVVIQGHEFTSIMFSIGYRMPSYDAWLFDVDQREAYAFHRRFLQQLQWKVSAPRWVLKSPGHLLALPALFETYPDACVVQLHRDPVEVIASLANLTRMLRRLSSRRVDPVELGTQTAAFWARALERAHAFRERHPELRNRFLDVQFSDLCGDPLEVVHAIYRHCGRSLAADAELRIKRFLDANLRPAREASPERMRVYGLEPAREAQRFAWYREVYGFAR
jgi:hypothetical protein